MLPAAAVGRLISATTEPLISTLAPAGPVGPVGPVPPVAPSFPSLPLPLPLQALPRPVYSQNAT